MRALASLSLPLEERPQRDPLTFHPFDQNYRHVAVASSWGIFEEEDLPTMQNLWMAPEHELF